MFADRYAELRDPARELKKRLAPADWVQHSTVKLAAGVRRLVMEIAPEDPLALEFHLRGDLTSFYRVSGKGLPPRCRLVWTASPHARTIIFLYVNDDATLRRTGARSDPYERFRAMIRREEIGADFDQNLAMWRQANGETD